MLSGKTMSDLVSDRIERALKRIEVAATAHARLRARLETRHETLRGRIESAIADLDVLIAGERDAETDADKVGDEEDEG